MNVVTLDSQNRVVLPSEVRATLGIGPGDALLVLQEGDRIYLLSKAAMLDALAADALEEHARGETIPLRQMMGEDGQP